MQLTTFAVIYLLGLGRSDLCEGLDGHRLTNPINACPMVLHGCLSSQQIPGAAVDWLVPVGGGGAIVGMTRADTLDAPIRCPVS